MDEVDVVLALSPLEGVTFERPTLVVPLPADVVAQHLSSEGAMHDAPIAAILHDLVPKARPTRVALAGHGAEATALANQLLAGPDGRHVDAVLLTNTAVPQGSVAGTIDLDGVIGLSAAAHLAAIGGRLVAVTGNNETTSNDTVMWLWREATGSMAPRFDHAAPVGLLAQRLDPAITVTVDGHVTAVTDAPLQMYCNRGTLWTLYYASVTEAADEIIDTQVLRTMVQELLAPRWNSIAPLDPICLTSKPDVCHRSTFLSDAYLAGTAEPMPLDLDHHADPTIPGFVAPTTAPSDDTSKAVRWVAGILAATVVVEIARRTFGYLTRKAAER